jgi:DNA-directed RNA polymerase subunit RPC12/RpoP
MEKYYRVNEVKEIIKKLAKEPAYQHDGEDFYAGVYTVESALTDLEEVEADIDELKKEVADLNNRRHLIWAIGVDYDGCNTVESLKGLIDELVSYTQLPREQVPDITSRTGRWIDVSVEPDRVRWKCSSCGKETSLPNYDKANYCFNCGAKMKEENS